MVARGKPAKKIGLGLGRRVAGAVGSRPWGPTGVNLLGLSAGNAVNGVAHILRDRRISKGLWEPAVAHPRSFIGFDLFLLEKPVYLARRGKR